MSRARSIAASSAKRVLGRAGYTVAYDNDYEPEAQRIMNSASAHTMTTRPRMYALWQAVRYVTAANVEGAIVECGVWRGGSMFAAALTLNELGSTDRELVLCDTYEGMTEPTDADVNAIGHSAGDLLNRNDSQSVVTRAEAPLTAVTKLMNSSGYPQDKIRYVVGDVLETLPEQAPESIAILRLDTDWYESTKHELETLFERISPGGVLLLDDYGFWQGARQATDEFFAASKHKVMLHRVDSGCRVAMVTGV